MNLESLQKLVDEATPIEFWQKRTNKCGQVFGLWYRHFAEGPHTNREQALKDADFLCAARTAMPLLIEVAKQAADIGHDVWCGHGGGGCDCNRSELSKALAALEEA